MLDYCTETTSAFKSRIQSFSSSSYLGRLRVGAWIRAIESIAKAKTSSLCHH